MANAAVTNSIGAARAKTDQLDARTLAQLLGTGFFPEVWLGSEPTRLARRRMSRRAQLVRERTGLKNQIHAVLHRNLVERPPASDLFGVKGLRWLAGVELPDDECETVSSCLRQLQFLGDELDRLDQVIAEAALEDRSIQLLLTVPGVNLTTASAFMAAVGDISRFDSRVSSSAIWVWIPRFTSPGSLLLATVPSPSRDALEHGGPWSSQLGWLLGLPGRCTLLLSASGLGAAPTWRPWQWGESWWCCSGTCSQRMRSTPMAGLR